MSGNLQALLEERDSLPGLPNLDSLRHQAYQVLDLNRRIVEEAQAEVDKARAILGQLGAKLPKTPAPKRLLSCSEAAYHRVLEAMADRGESAPLVLARDAHVSKGHIGIVLRVAAERGHATKTDPNRTRGVDWRLTPAGMDFVTRPRTPSTNGNVAH